MAIYAQHGHAKSDKIDSALAEGTLDGVILGARNETPEKMKECVNTLREFGDVLFDPQFYVSAFSPPNDRFLPEYPYYKPGLSAADFTGARRLREYCKKTLDFEISLGVTKLISPTILCDSFNSRWGQIALNIADTALEYHSSLNDPPPLLISFVIAEQALTPRRDLEAFLDQVTSWELEGVYLIIAREESGYSQAFDSQRLAHALYLTHVLGEVNGFEVVNGFADFCGILLRAVGGRAFATGWWQTLRQFNKRSFTKQKPGGSLPRLRYSSGPLLNSIFLSELDQARDAGMLHQVLSGIELDEGISADSDEWTQKKSELAHWQTLSKLDRSLPPSFSKRVKHIEGLLAHAASVYQLLEDEGVVFSSNTGPTHIDGWADGLKTFKALIGM
jgi:hypothetical protein